MKKFVKVTLVTSLICFLLGIIICMIVGLNKGFQVLHTTDNWWNGRKPGVSATMNFDEAYSEEITALDVDFDYGELIIKSGDEFRVVGNDVVENTKSYVKDGTLKIEQTVYNGWTNWGSANLNNKQKLEITVPEDVYLDFFRLSTGMSETDIDGIMTRNAKFTFGAGNTNMNNVTADKVIIDGGVGDTRFTNVKFNDIDADLGVGNMWIKGEITGDCDIDTGVGNFDMEIIGNSDDYFFDVDSGVGGVNINGSRVSGIYGRRNSDNKIEIDAGVGEVRVSFTDK